MPEKFNLAIQHLKVEFLPTPLGINNPVPLLAWQIISERPGILISAWKINDAEFVGPQFLAEIGWQPTQQV